jgi:hypothetical protein
LNEKKEKTEKVEEKTKQTMTEEMMGDNGKSIFGKMH